MVKLVAIMRGFKCYLGPSFSGRWPHWTGDRYRESHFYSKYDRDWKKV